MSKESVCEICKDTIEFINVCVLCGKEICDDCTIYPIGDKTPVCVGCRTEA